MVLLLFAIEGAVFVCVSLDVFVFEVSILNTTVLGIFLVVASSF